MLSSVRGVFRNGRVELLEAAPSVKEAVVIVTFLSNGGPLDLATIGMSEAQAQDLRGRLKPFAEDWNRPEMDVYDAE